jgi:tripartite-type tricarboxylate transporter receptor subunit TctC
LEDGAACYDEFARGLVTIMAMRAKGPRNLKAVEGDTKMSRSLPTRIALVALCVAAASGAAAQEPFYKGKRLTVLVNYAAGGPADVEARLYAKYIGRHIEGQPSVIVQNIDGAGGLVGASYMGEVAPRDGSMMGYLSGAAWRFVNDPKGTASISESTGLSRTSPAPASTTCARTSRPA